jgi:hypothetical protein
MFRLLSWVFLFFGLFVGLPISHQDHNREMTTFCLLNRCSDL